ncbi:MAG: filamentous hemagglutinin N-terminal domain-containing protein, partial [Rhodoferax sp.]|nr:filamentous hemagglutinin N-terminal domain-containing protein [Rhodoferax sp.]
MRFTPGFRRQALVAALSAIYGAAPQLVQANPTGAQVVNGQAVLQTQGNKLTVTNTPGAIINWQSFSIGAGETTYFHQQSAASAVLNRVQAQNPSLQSRIDGTLGSNGRVFLINPNGIVFGAGSVIDTQGFVASTLSMRDDDFKAGKLKFARQGAAADLLAQGRITSGNGDVYLVAPNISVDGKAVISTQGGNVVLAAGEMVEITGRNLNDITFAVQNQGNQVLNLGTLSGGAVGVFAGTLTHSGQIEAQALARDGGKLVLKALGNVTLGSGSTSSAYGPDLGGQVHIESRFGNVVVDARAVVSAQALAAARPLVTPRGGSVTIDAPDGLVAIEHEAVVNASGAHGGAVSVNSARFLQDGAIRADGQYSVGGTITVQADSRVVQSRNASMTATGVLRGGAIHLSVDADPAGSGHLFTSARIDASASTGDGGQVTVTGRELAFVGARVLANGDAGGGQVRLGGGRAGKDSSIANAQNIVASGSSSFEASARQDGDGGSVIAWADGSNRFASVVEARGGVGGGNGGFIEVSGKQETQFGGVANASAPLGKAGTFLLDPKFILIQAPVITAGTTVELIDPNPGTGDLFGSSMERFNINAPNETILIANSQDDLGGTNAGAVYLFDGSTGALISHLRGSTAGDQVGSLIQFVGGTKRAIRSPSWDNAGVVNAGAITWFDGAVGLSGTVSVSNSLVGSHANDAVGTNNLVQLNFGTRYYAHTPQWDASKGALTFIDISAPVTGVVSSGNSLVGSLANDRLGSGGIFNISSSKTLVFSPEWNGNRGAVTWFDNTTGTVGDVSSANSLVGSTAGDRVGSGFYDFFGTGKVAIFSPDWSNGLLAQAGAITWGSTSVATTGVIGVANSLFGANALDRVGDNGIDNLAFVGGSQKYYVQTPGWGGGAGAVTFVDSVAPTMGGVTAANSLVGEDPSSRIGSGQIRVLNNGNFVVISPDATVAGVAGAGAITWASGLGGPTTQGVVGAANSLVGTSANDRVGNGTFVDLFTSNYVVTSPSWRGGRGAVTFGSGTTQIIGNPDLVGTVGGHSLFGTTSTSAIGSAGVRELNGNGNFIVFSPGHGVASGDNFGAVSIGDVTTGFLGASTAPVTNSNSIVGTQVGDAVGINPGSNFFDRGFAGYYLLRTPLLRGTSGAVNAAGVTFLSGVPVAGDINTLSGASGNSIVGSRANDNVGSSITFLNSNNNFVVASPTWDNGVVGNAGAVTFGDRTSGFTSGSRTPGVITAANSLVGSGAGDQIG